MGVTTSTTRRIEDAGEHIGGARKDFYKTAMTIADLAGMTPAEKASLVRKDNVWPVPDYAALAADGAPATGLALMKVLRDKLSNAPVMHRKSWDPQDLAQAYVEMVGFIRRHCETDPTADRIKSVFPAAMDHFGYRDRPRDDRFQQLFFGVHSGRHVGFDVGQAEARRAAKLIAEGFPATIEPWKRNTRIHERSNGTFVAVRNNRIVQENLPSEADALRILETSYERKKAEPATGGKMPLPPHLKRIERTNECRRTGPVSPNAFIEEFGFRGVEFGNWLPDKERQQVLDMAFDAMDDLALILGLTPGAVALKGTLAIAFGARGQGSAAAHYEPGRKVINVTRLSGAGKTLHEFWHGLDNWLGAIGHDDPLEGQEVRYASGGHTQRAGSRAKALPKLPTEVVEAIDGVMKAIYTRPVTDAEHNASLRALVRNAEIQMPRLEAELAAAVAVPTRLRKNHTRADEIRDRIKWATELAEKARAELEAIAAGAPRDIRQTRKTDFYLEACKLCGKSGEYWKRPIELFARAGEAWGLDKLNGEFLLSQYLVHGVEGDRFASQEYRGNPYPTGDERRRINAAIDRLVALLPALLENREATAGPDGSTDSADAATPVQPETVERQAEAQVPAPTAVALVEIQAEDAIEAHQALPPANQVERLVETDATAQQPPTPARRAVQLNLF